MKCLKILKGDAPLIQVQNTSLTTNINEVTQGFSENYVQLLIEDVPSNVINLFDTTTNVFFSLFILLDFRNNLFHHSLYDLKKIKTAISNSFGIRCPNSIIASGTTDTFLVYDYETCQWDNMPVQSVAFCGKCSNVNNANLFYNTANNTLSYNYV